MQGSKLKNKLLLYIALLLFSYEAKSQRTTPSSYSANIPKSYVRTWGAAYPENDPNILPAQNLREVKQATAYVDGLARPLQTVVKRGSLNTSNNANTDLVSPSEYDQFGRTIYINLPHPDPGATDGLFKLNPFQPQVDFYNSFLTGQDETNTNNNRNWAYSQTDYEASPLNRVEKQYAPGKSWVGNNVGVVSKAWYNTATDYVKKWYVTDVVNSFGTYYINGTYSAGELFKNVMIDEHGKQVIEFKDKNGKVILKKIQLTDAAYDNGTGKDYTGWLCTYYIYDDVDNLRCVIQPEGVKTLSDAANWDLNYSSGVLLNEQCFRYEYDQRNRMVMKKVPGAEVVYMIYDARDRLVMMQDANLRNAQPYQKFLFTQYDDLNRPIRTGTISTTGDWIVHRDYAATSTNYPWVEGYTNEIFTETHYDDYTNLPAGLSSSLYNSGYSTYLNASAFSPDYAEPLIQSNGVRGMVTWTRVKVLGTANQYLASVNIYDNKGRVIQTQSINVSGGVDVVTNQYSFSGQVLRSHIKHQKAGTNAQTYDVATKITYDDLGRVTLIEKNVNGSGWKQISSLQYDALGQLKSKKLAPAYNSNAGLETLTYDYNIRGWLLGMNRDYAKAPWSTGNYFGFDLAYDNIHIKLSNGTPIWDYQHASFNGNITGTVWKSKGDNVLREHEHYYDNANRYNGSTYIQYSNGSWNSTDMNYQIAGLTYDANGNILTMKQYGWTLAAPVGIIDNLTYVYYPNSNKLKQVTDANNDNNSKLGDFKYDASLKGAIDYGYDANGNLTTDLNKRIGASASNIDPNTGLQPGGSIYYNYLSLPTEIAVKDNQGNPKGGVYYTYDAAGNKLRKDAVELASSTNNWVQTTTSTTYIGGFVYETKYHSPSQASDYTDQLQFVSMEEGRTRPIRDANNSITSFTFDYFIKDHLGNVRMVLTEEAKQDKYPVASLEDSKLTIEDDYYTIDNSKIVSANTVTGIPAYTNDNGIGNNPSDPTFEQANSQKLYKLNSNTNKIGLSIALKVMAGDKLDIFGKSYWFENNTGGSGVNAAPTVIDLLNGLMGAPTGATAAGHTTATELNGVSAVTVPIGNFIGIPGRDDAAYPQRPKAFINYIFLDEQFKYVNGGFSAVNTTPGLKTHYSELQNLTATKNGYVYIYVSNESPVNVFFDNLQVVHTRGPLLEETHYYPFGLTMAGISSRALAFGNPGNKNKYQQYELNNDFDINLYESFYRSHDPQIGRFWQTDPKPSASFSLYSSMKNNPLLFADPLGDTTIKGIKYEPQTGQYATYLKNVTVKATFYKNQYLNLIKRSPTFAERFLKDIPWNDFAQLAGNEIEKRFVAYLNKYPDHYRYLSGKYFDVRMAKYGSSLSGAGELFGVIISFTDYALPQANGESGTLPDPTGISSAIANYITADVDETLINNSIMMARKGAIDIESLGQAFQSAFRKGNSPGLKGTYVSSGELVSIYMNNGIVDPTKLRFPTYGFTDQYPVRNEVAYPHFILYNEKMFIPIIQK